MKKGNKPKSSSKGKTKRKMAQRSPQNTESIKKFFNNGQDEGNSGHKKSDTKWGDITKNTIVATQAHSKEEVVSNSKEVKEVNEMAEGYNNKKDTQSKHGHGTRTAGAGKDNTLEGITEEINEGNESTHDSNKEPELHEAKEDEETKAKIVKEMRQNEVTEDDVGSVVSKSSSDGKDVEDDLPTPLEIEDDTSMEVYEENIHTEKEDDNSNDSVEGGEEDDPIVTVRIVDRTTRKMKVERQMRYSEAMKLKKEKKARSKNKCKETLDEDQKNAKHTPLNEEDSTYYTNTPINEALNNNQMQEHPQRKETIVGTTEAGNVTHTDSHTQSIDEVQLDDNDSQESEAVEEEEDDENTVDSGTTTQYNRRNMNNVVLPPFVRYQMMILLDQDTNNSNLTDEEGELKSPVQRLKEVLQSLVVQAKIHDADAKIISWSTSNNFTYLPETFPDDLATIAKYFKGVTAKVKADKRIYLRFGIHTHHNARLLEEHLSNWASLYAYTFRKCIIQAESEALIGWLVYSTQFTDTEVLRKDLMEATNWEWGFKLGSVTSDDKEEKWNKRIKALGVYVPDSVQEFALAEIGNYLESNENSLAGLPTMKDKFMFVQTEKVMSTDTESHSYFKEMVERHQTHVEALAVQLTTSIKVDIDRPYMTRSGYKLTLRDMILQIKVQDRKNKLFGMNLFHSIDFHCDSSKLWLGTTTGPGGSCHVLTFYKATRSEAIKMIRGIGMYVRRMNGTEVATKMFTINHFRATVGWSYSSTSGTFRTPEDRQRKANMHYDSNLEAIQRLRRLQVEQKKKENSNLTEEQLAQQRLQEITGSPDMNIVTGDRREDENAPPPLDTETDTHNGSNVLNNRELLNPTEPTGIGNDTLPPTEVIGQQSGASVISADLTEVSDMEAFAKEQRLKELLKIQGDKDLDSLNHKSGKTKKVPEECTYDNESVASSLTCESIDSGQSNFSGFSQQSDATSNSISNQTKAQKKPIISQELIQRITEEGMTGEEIVQRVEAHYRHNLNRMEIIKDIEVAEFLHKKGLELPTAKHKPTKYTQDDDQSTSTPNTKITKGNCEQEDAPKNDNEKMAVDTTEEVETSREKVTAEIEKTQTPMNRPTNNTNQTDQCNIKNNNKSNYDNLQPSSSNTGMSK